MSAARDADGTVTTEIGPETTVRELAKLLLHQLQTHSLDAANVYAPFLAPDGQRMVLHVELVRRRAAPLAS